MSSTSYKPEFYHRHILSSKARPVGNLSLKGAFDLDTQMSPARLASEEANLTQKNLYTYIYVYIYGSLKLWDPPRADF